MNDPVFLFATAGAVLLALAFIALPLLRGGQKLTLIAAVVFVPASTLAIYWWVGTPAGIDPDTGETGQIRAAVTDLARRAVREPDSAENWARLGLAYKSLEEFSSAEHALRRALYIDSDASFIKAELGETLLYASGRPPASRRSPKPAASSSRRRQPEGHVAARARRLPAGTLRGSHSTLRGAHERRAGRQQYSTHGRRVPGRVKVEGTGADTGSDPANPTGTDAGPSLLLRLGIDDQLAGRLEGDETVFLAVRRAGGGPPLAVRRLRADELPLEVTIDDDDAMMAGSGLSSADAVVVVARVSFQRRCRGGGR